MSQETNLNITPYFDDYDEAKNYHRILFKPSFPIQARELTQLQSILQNQIERFGQNIYKTGTVISGCSVSLDPFYNFVRIKDLDADNYDVNINDLEGCYVIDQSTGMKAIVVNVEDGLESSANNDLKTLYVKYLSVGSNATQNAFSDGSALFAQRAAGTVEDFPITAAGSGYSNTMFVYAIQTSPAPTVNAYGRLVTNSAGSITDVVVINKGEGYTKDPDLLTTRVVYANGVAVTSPNNATLGVINYVAQPIVASNGTGVGYGLKVSDGVIFQKGFFVRVDPQEIVVSKYLTTANGYPNNVSVGFSTEESIVNSSVDTSLLDNAQGYTNFQAPGSDRLKLTPTLVVKTANDLSDVIDGVPSVQNFFTLVEFQNGYVVRDKTSTQFNAVDTQLAKRTAEESGDYVVRPISLTTEEAGIVYGNNFSNVVNVIVGKGVAYVQGYRNELINNLRVPIPRANTTLSTNNQVISTSYENYFSVPQNKWFGIANIQYGETITLFANTVAVGNSGIVYPGGAVPSNLNSSLGTTKVVGTAKVRAITYEGFGGSIADNKYNVYVYDVQVNSGFNPSDIQAIGSNSKFVAEVSSNNDVSLIGTQYEPIIFPLGLNALDSISDDTFYYKKQTDAVQVSNTGVFSLSADVGEQFLYTADPVSELQKTDFVVVSRDNIVSTNLAGTVSVNSAGYITSSGSPDMLTLFDAYKNYGLHIKIANSTASYYYPVIAVKDSNTAQIPATANIVISSANIAYCCPNNTIVNSKLFTVNAATGSLTFTLNPWSNVATSSTIGNVSVICTSIATPTSANLVLDVHYVKISNTLAATLPHGPWCLGIPNVVKINGVFVGSGDTFADANTDPNISNNFELVTGQKDSVYGLSYLKSKNASAFTLTSDKNLLVRVLAFRRQTPGDYITLESYVNANGSSAALTYIPVYRTSAGRSISLRDAVDFRPFVSNTISYSNTASGAITLHASTTNATHIAYSSAIVETVPSTSRKYPSPSGLYEADMSYYIPRRDKIIMDKNGNVKAIVGVPSLKPVSPKTPIGTFVLGEVYVPPYPSLAYPAAVQVGRPDYGVLTSTKQQTVFTMRDIQKIEDRVERLEYYSSFSLLESQTKSLKITSEANTQLERFKHGFFVDPMKDNGFSEALESGTFQIDAYNEIATPRFAEIPLKLKIANTTSTAIFDSVVSDASHVLLATTALKSEAKFDKPTSQRNVVNGFVKYNGIVYVNPPYDISTSSGSGGIDEYVKPQSITIYVNGLQPNKRHFVFFDGKNITSSVRTVIAPASNSSALPMAQYTIGTDVYGNANIYKRVREGGGSDGAYTGGGFKSGWIPSSTPIGSGTLISSIDGKISVQYDIPARSFTFGPKDIIVMDIDSIGSESGAMSIAKGLFYGLSSTFVPQQPPVVVAPPGPGTGGKECWPLSTETFAFLNANYGMDVALWAMENLDSCTVRWVGDKEFYGSIADKLRGNIGTPVPKPGQNTTPIIIEDGGGGLDTGGGDTHGDRRGAGSLDVITIGIGNGSGGGLEVPYLGIVTPLVPNLDSRNNNLYNGERVDLERELGIDPYDGQGGGYDPIDDDSYPDEE